MVTLFGIVAVAPLALAVAFTVTVAVVAAAAAVGGREEGRQHHGERFLGVSWGDNLLVGGVDLDALGDRGGRSSDGTECGRGGVLLGEYLNVLQTRGCLI